MRKTNPHPVLITLVILLVLVGAFSLHFFVLNAPILIESDSFGGTTGKLPMVMLTPDKKVTVMYVGNGSMGFSHYTLSDAEFLEMRRSIDAVKVKLAPHYVYSYGFDDADAKVFIRNSYGEQTTYLYPYTTDHEILSAGSANWVRAKLTEDSSKEFVELLDNIYVLRKDVKLDDSVFDLFMWTIWSNKLTKEWIEPIRQEWLKENKTN